MTRSGRGALALLLLCVASSQGLAQGIDYQDSASLPSNPAACAANNFATDIAQDGTLTCARPSVSNLSDGSTGTGAVALQASPSITGLLTVTQGTLGQPVTRYLSTATNDDPVEEFVQNRVATTDATVTTIHTFTIAPSTTVGILGRLVARRTGGVSGSAEDGAFYEIKAVYKNVTGTATAIGSPSLTAVGESQAAWDITVSLTGATVLLRVTGAAANNITWHLTAYTYSVGS